jgi:hypothetical protein
MAQSMSSHVASNQLAHVIDSLALSFQKFGLHGLKVWRVSPSTFLHSAVGFKHRFSSVLNRSISWEIHGPGNVFGVELKALLVRTPNLVHFIRERSLVYFGNGWSVLAVKRYCDESNAKFNAKSKRFIFLCSIDCFCTFC